MAQSIKVNPPLLWTAQRLKKKKNFIDEFCSCRCLENFFKGYTLLPCSSAISRDQVQLQKGKILIGTLAIIAKKPNFALDVVWNAPMIAPIVRSLIGITYGQYVNLSTIVGTKVKSRYFIIREWTCSNYVPGSLTYTYGSWVCLIKLVFWHCKQYPRYSLEPLDLKGQFDFHWIDPFI